MKAKIVKLILSVVFALYPMLNYLFIWALAGSSHSISQHSMDRQVSHFKQSVVIYILILIGVWILDWGKLKAAVFKMLH